MLTDKELKKQFKAKCAVEYEKYYPVAFLKSRGFKRGKCSKCSTNFWSVHSEQTVCGDASCSGGFRFIGNSPARNKLDYVSAWKKFAEIMSSLGYTPVKRYPVIARWNPTTDFTIASIAAFQPYVVNGQVDPPANKLVIPQFCLRFGDLDNVGITGSHYTGFIMMGQHAFVAPKEYTPDLYLEHIHKWLSEGVGIPDNELTFHEDAWAGGGNFGPSMEFFSRGLELGNQVYMQYEQTSTGSNELKIKVLDMGEGLERVAWFTQGKHTSYETTFPTVMKKLRERTGVETDDKIVEEFLPYASYLNVDESEDLDKTWAMIAARINTDVETLKKNILPLAALASIADHARSLLFAITDGGLPSNVGGMYNLRVILRRALGFISANDWNIDLGEVCGWHAEYLKPLFPELLENLNTVVKIIDVEKHKYIVTMEKSASIISRLTKEDITDDKLLSLYDSQGIAPEIVQKECSRLGVCFKIPDNFYQRVSELHETSKQEHATVREKIELPKVADTKALYYEDYKINSFTAKVLAVLDNYAVLDQTAFYPTSGGQMHDNGTINKEEVVDAFKQEGMIVHKLRKAPEFKIGDTVNGLIDKERRIQLTQHHTSTHIVGTAARLVLGNHIQQAGAKKDVDKAHLDITHYEALSKEEVSLIERKANELVKQAIPVIKKFLPRTLAEQTYGMRIYQGGAVPGKTIRIVEIKDLDVQACGGTHLDNTSEAGAIKIIKTSKIQDGIVRIVFTAGKASQKVGAGNEEIAMALSQELGCMQNEVPGRCEELFISWKKAKKAGKAEKLQLISTAKYNGEILSEACRILKTQPEHILRTVQRFKKDISEWSA